MFYVGNVAEGALTNLAADGVTRIVLAIGGSASTDGGAGLLQAVDAIDGLLFGDAPRQGYVRGRGFLHPELTASATREEAAAVTDVAFAFFLARRVASPDGSDEA